MQRFYFCFALLLPIFSTGCVDRHDVEQPRFFSPAGEIHGSITQGQTFTALENGLCRIDVLLTTYHRVNSGKVIFHLREDISASVDIVRLEFDAKKIKNNKYRSFRFHPLPDSAGRSYYFFLEAVGSMPGSAISAWRSERDVYPGGSQVISHQTDKISDLTFRLFNRSSFTVLVDNLAHGIKPFLGFVSLFFLLFCLPGLGILMVFGIGQRIKGKYCDGIDHLTGQNHCAGDRNTGNPFIHG